MFQRVNRLFQDGGNRTGVEESMKNPIGLHVSSFSFSSTFLAYATLKMLVPTLGQTHDSFNGCMIDNPRPRYGSKSTCPAYTIIPRTSHGRIATSAFPQLLRPQGDYFLLPMPEENASRFQMRQVAGYFVNYFDSRAIMDQLQIPDKGVDEIMLKFPINDWLAKTKRHNIVCTTVGHVYSGYKEAEGAFLITQIKISRGRQSQNIEPLYERDQDKYVKRWLVEEGGAKEEGLQWMSFPDGDKLYLLVDGIRPERNDFKGPWFHYQFTNDQNRRLTSSGKGMGEWVAEATANGEVVERIWPPQEHPSPP